MGENGTVANAYRFGSFQIHPAERLLRRDGTVVPLTPKAIDTLLALIEARGRLVEKDDLMRRLWPETFVEEANLSNQISLLRKALGDAAGKPSYIETVSRRGYRFIADMADVENLPDAAAAPQFDAGATVVSRTALSRRLAIAGLITLVVGVSGIAVWRGRGETAAAIASPLKITRLTTSGQVRHATISADGKYAAYTAVGRDGESLWLTPVNSMSPIEVARSANATFFGVTFSPDVTSIYYVVREQNPGREGALYRVPVAGVASAPTLVLTNIDTPVAFSPDGTRIAYVASSEMRGRSALMVANSDGSAPRALATRVTPEAFAWAGAGPSWTPGGRSILSAATGTDARGHYSSIVEVQAADGSQRTLGSHRWSQVGRIGWLGARSFVVAASERLDANQLWHVSYPGGDVLRITNDESRNYVGAAVTADGTSLATVQRDPQATLWTASGDDAATARRLTEGKYDGRFGVAAAPDGRIVYHSMESGNEDIWIVNADGSARRQLTVDAATDDRPSVSADGRHVVFASNRAGDFNIWRMDIDGTNQRQLTRGRNDVTPVVTPDGQWVVYSSSSSGTPALWKVPLGGGEPAVLSALAATEPAISPDGAFVAFRYFDNPDANGTIGILRLTDGKVVKVFDRSASARLGRDLLWTTHGLTFVVTTEGLSNIWTQAPDGGAPRQLTRFQTGRILRHSWSRGGRELIFVQPTFNNDVVLIGNLPAGR